MISRIAKRAAARYANGQKLCPVCDYPPDQCECCGGTGEREVTQDNPDFVSTSDVPVVCECRRT